MFRLLSIATIKPKEGVAEKFDININKKWSLFFGILEFSTIYTMISLIINFFKNHAGKLEANVNIPAYIKVLPYLQIVLIVSIFITGIFYFCNKLIAYKIYFVQFFFRLLFFMPSFGLLLMLKFFISAPIFINIMGVVCVVLEICRFVITLFIVHESKRFV